MRVSLPQCEEIGAKREAAMEREIAEEEGGIDNKYVP